jgi:hypothetical protein
MEYPTKLYPQPPKPEWFLRVTNEMHTASQSTAVSGDFVKMGASAYSEYLSAHASWLKNVRNIGKEEHDLALVRRHFDGLKEVVAPRDDSPWQRNISVPGWATKNGAEAKLTVKPEKKVFTAPTLSTKPHRAEKRVEKKKLDAEKTKVVVEVIKAKTSALVDTIPRKKEIVNLVEKVRQEQPLRKVELSAAQHAAKRASAISAGSKDLVANVDPDNQWKVVTRKKGECVKVSEILQNRDGKPFSQTVSFKDPSASIASLPMAAVRQPNSVGK